MNRYECLNELMSYGCTYEEASIWHKAICKQNMVVLNHFLYDLTERIGEDKAKEVYDRMTVNWFECGINPLHTMAYAMISEQTDKLKNDNKYVSAFNNLLDYERKLERM